MTAPKTPAKIAYVITANDLYDGEVVFWASPTLWQRQLAQAHAFTDKTEAEAELAKVRANEVVGAYIIDVAHPKIRPTHIREEIRALGPSNYFHGKQQDYADATSKRTP